MSCFLNATRTTCRATSPLSVRLRHGRR
jgi:hypothetical protein